jgi:hypothetical protein
MRVPSRAFVGVVFAACVVGAASCSHAPASGSAIDPDLAAEAFVWGYPLVVSERTMQTVALLVGTNTLFHQSALADVTTPRLIVSPNQDTLYSVAVLDLRSEPMVLTVPDVLDRYWAFQFLDAWTSSFHYIGTRATSGKGGTFLIAPPGWQGTPPEGAVVITSPTQQLFLLGRYLVKDANDIASVNALARTLVPLHTITGDAAPPLPPALGRAPGSASDVGTGGDAAFFDELGDALAIDAPATDSDRAALARYAKLGVGAGSHPSEVGSPSALAAGVTKGLATIESAARDPASRTNGWTVHLDAGTYSDAPLLRAVISKLAWGANVREEAVYPISLSDAAGQPYAGREPRVLHFNAGALPPVDDARGFWSLTLYGPDRFFVANGLHRYQIGDRTPGLVTNADGSLDLFIQSDTPAGQENNWLPAPAGEYTLMLRVYLPKAAVQGGTYVYPPVTLR